MDKQIIFTTLLLSLSLIPLMKLSTNGSPTHLISAASVNIPGLNFHSLFPLKPPRALFKALLQFTIASHYKDATLNTNLFFLQVPRNMNIIIPSSPYLYVSALTMQF